QRRGRANRRRKGAFGIEPVEIGLEAEDGVARLPVATVGYARKATLDIELAGVEAESLVPRLAPGVPAVDTDVGPGPGWRRWRRWRLERHIGRPRGPSPAERQNRGERGEHQMLFHPQSPIDRFGGCPHTANRILIRSDGSMSVHESR